MIRVASVPSDHVYVRHLANPDGEDIVRLPGPAPCGAASGHWAPSSLLDAAWVRTEAETFDLLHVHFGFEHKTPSELRELVAALQAVRRPLVLTVHDLRNPHLVDRAQHDQALDILVPAATSVITLTRGAAAVIGRRWGREAAVIPHPHIVSLDHVGRPRGRHKGFIVGLYAKPGRANHAPEEVARVLAAELSTVGGGRLQIDLHDDPQNGAFSKLPVGVDLRIHPRFNDDELFSYLASLDVAVLPYRFGTHSGWLEACHDLGTAVIAPDCGFYAEQSPCFVYGHGESGLDAESLRVALRDSIQAGPAKSATSGERRRQRIQIARTHGRIYRDALATTRQQVEVLQ